MSVYFAQVDEYVKVGYSKDPVARAGSVTRLGKRPPDVPLKADADLLGWVPGDRKREAELHAQFASARAEDRLVRLLSGGAA